MSPDSPFDVPAILWKAKEGDVNALGPVLTDMRERLKTVAICLTPARLRQRVPPSELIQDSFVVAIERIGMFRGGTEEELFSWMTAIVSSVTLSAIRNVMAAKRCAALEVSFSEDEHSGHARTHSSMSALEQAMIREESHLAAKTFARLPKESQKLIN